MFKPYGVISDTHHHNWSAFATTLDTGVNSRLQVILDETKRCAAEVRAAGGDRIYHGGDLFHVRGSIAPSVLNPTIDCYKEIIASGIGIVINAGNHDLEGKEAARVSSAITSLEGIGCRVVNSPNYGSFDQMVVIPWIPQIADLKAAIEYIAPVDRPNCDLLLHAPIDGVIPGLPDHGLTAEWLAETGYRRVFSGHYHHHKHVYDASSMTFGTDVYSIGSLTGQTWSDINAKSGFLIVTEKEVKWHKTHAPSFVEVNATTDPLEIPLIVDGNYVRVKVQGATQTEVESVRAHMLGLGALGVQIIPVKDVPGSTSVRAGAVVTKGATLEQNIGDFITAKGFGRSVELGKLCNEILTTVRSVA